MKTKINIKNTNKDNPSSLSGTDLIKPKKKRKNHSGIILSDVLTTLHKINDSSWNTKNQPRNTMYTTRNKDINKRKLSRIAIKVKKIRRSK